MQQHIAILPPISSPTNKDLTSQFGTHTITDFNGNGEEAETQRAGISNNDRTSPLNIREDGGTHSPSFEELLDIKHKYPVGPVSYTHLTLPTIYSV